MKSISIRLWLIASAMAMPLLHAQEGQTKVGKIEQKVLRNQYRQAVQALVDAGQKSSSNDVPVSPGVISKQLRWLSILSAQLVADQKADVINSEEMKSHAEDINGLAWSMVRARESAKRQPAIALKLINIALEMGGEDGQLKPMMQDTKARALFLLGNHEEAIALQESAVAAATNAAMKTEMLATLNSFKKGELPEVPTNESGSLKIAKKLSAIIIPKVDFDDTPIEEAVRFLQDQCAKLDTTEPDPKLKGVKILLELPKDPLGRSLKTKVHILRLTNVPASTVLKYICESTKMRYSVDDNAVTIVSPGYPYLLTLRYLIPKEMGDSLVEIMKYLDAKGIKFGAGASASFVPSTHILTVNNSQEELDKVGQLMGSFNPANSDATKPEKR
ncbi:hypothetical protein JIN85_05880 [Luteolibacter pohnpeiensis]|uniref:Uncharacterized protein n=1 Tax=Luteolibacter pohnpeiensis TaxID=454153 RepID=A0A934S9Q7_9BACT|nr:hypothetical protein [Luteolibacter pohnpeiensis]MBK1881934.1 hypothetical protein [Luteolibacter pohnpeiensis]